MKSNFLYVGFFYGEGPKIRCGGVELCLVLCTGINVTTCTELPSFITRFYYCKVNYNINLKNKNALFYVLRSRVLVGIFFLC